MLTIFHSLLLFYSFMLLTKNKTNSDQKPTYEIFYMIVSKVL